MNLRACIGTASGTRCAPNSLVPSLRFSYLPGAFMKSAFPLRVLFLSAAACILAARGAEADPLFDWSDWEKYRSTVQHPSGAFKPADVDRAKANIQRYEWARNYATNVDRTARAMMGKLTPDFLVAMIPETTPGDSKFTPCPGCRDAGKPWHPHGQWSWTPAAPEQLTCDICRTVYPNDRYPETVVLETTWGKPQQLTFYAGEPFVVFSYKTGRPSFTANVRARKIAYMAGVCRSLAEAYLLTGKPEYARGVRDVLLRFATCYPHWLVHTGYGEYADMDPRVAAQFINQLPAPELCPPPNRPDRKLHTGYWTAGRATGSGQESGFVCSLRSGRFGGGQPAVGRSRVLCARWSKRTTSPARHRPATELPSTVTPNAA
jgi:hypothetical protein